MIRGQIGERFFETYYIQRYNDDNEIEGIIGISLDITQRKQTQDEIQKYIHELHQSKTMLERYSSQLKEKNKILEESEKKLIDLNINKDKFFSIISHDLRSPFSSLIGLSDFMLTHFEEIEGDELLESLESFNRNVRNIYALLENLLAWSKIQMGKQEIETKNINVLEAVLSVLSVFNVSIKSKKITVEKDIDKDIHIFADPNMFNTSIRNIISNSIKFTPDKGKVSIIASVNNNNCELIIEDNGIGMDDDQMGRLFSIDKLQSRVGLLGEKGSGLGLILAKELVEANGGTVKVESEVDKGTRFTIILPRIDTTL